MKKQIIAIIAAIGISFAAVAPAKAQFWGGYGPVGWGWGGGYGYGGWGGYGYGGWGYGAAALGAGLAVGAIAGAIASQPYYAPGYAYPAYGYGSQRVKKNIVIKNSPGARVYEEDDIFGW